MKKRVFGASLLALSFLLVFVGFPNQVHRTLFVIKEAGIQLASVVLTHNFKTIAQIKSHYAAANAYSQTRVRILLVPGHEPNFGGAEFGSLKERDMTVELAQDLQSFLARNPHYQVFVTRDTVAWSPIFTSYYATHWDDIVAWTHASQDAFSHMVSVGSTTEPYSIVAHNTAPQSVALRLYGITKWSDENNIDIVIHIHINDNDRPNARQPGTYSGFAIYVPAAQYGNSTTTKAIAESVFNRLATYNPVSNLPGESSGIVDDPELIAVGSNNTADAASMLIEYGYIYEPQFQDATLRSVALKDLAFQTYLGLQDFFDPAGTKNLAGAYDTLILPHTWDTSLGNKKAPASEVFALQTALMYEGMYPPPDKTKNDCPRTGVIGDCTRASLQSFQAKYGLAGADGVVGPKTLQILNQL